MNELKRELSKLTGIDFFNPKFREVFKKHFPNDKDAEEEKVDKMLNEDEEKEIDDVPAEDVVDDVKDIDTDKAEHEVEDKVEDIDKAEDEREIDKIEEQEKAIKETYSAQLEALEQTNDELERQIKLQELLDALNKAKSKMVKTYVEGQGFVYTQDSSAVSQAEKNLQEYQRSERQRKEKESS